LDLLPSTDDQLVARLANGDAAALEMLYDRYVRQCFGLALRLVGEPQLAEEIVQEVFLKLWAQPSRYSAQKGQFISWLLSLVHHRSIDELRRKSRTEVTLETPDAGSVLNTEPNQDPEPGDQVWIAEQQRAVRRALASIPENQRQVLEMAYYGGLSQSEIATQLGQPLGTVKTRMRSGLQRLKAILDPLNLQAD
jgi:RNA polymerase sigma-70 factor (ECF subfamily)